MELLLIFKHCLMWSFFILSVKAIAPKDRTPVCRTDYRYRGEHDWIPYASNGGTWKVLIDQYDYQSILGESSIPPGVWTTVSNSGGSRQFGLGSGGECKHQLRAVDTYRDSNVDKWVITQAVDYLDAVEVIVNVSIRLVGCTQRRSASPPCINDFLTLHRYDTNTLSETERIRTSNYDPYLGTRVASRLQQSGDGDTVIVQTFQRPQNFNYTYFGIQDNGTTGTLGRLLVYYKVCPGKVEGLVTYPEVPHPLQGSSQPTRRNAVCAENASPVGSLETRAYNDGRCVQSVRCVCDEGYTQMDRQCSPCPRNSYRSVGNSSCVSCPSNSISDVASSNCTCSNNHFRAPTDSIYDSCTTPPSAPQSLSNGSFTNVSCTLTWAQPSNSGGRSDVSYHVLVYEEGTLIQNNTVPNTQYTVQGLRPVKTYSITVVAENGVSFYRTTSNDIEQRSRETRCTTLEGAPEMPSSFRIVENLVCIWQKPEVSNGVITGYDVEIKYEVDGTQKVVTRERDSSQFFYIFRRSDVPENTTATIRVRAKVMSHLGAWSAEIVTVPYASPCEDPDEVNGMTFTFQVFLIAIGVTAAATAIIIVIILLLIVSCCKCCSSRKIDLGKKDTKSNTYSSEKWIESYN